MTRILRPWPRHGVFLLLSFALLVCCCAGRCAGADGGWPPLLIVRFGNVDALDAEDGELASFLKSIRNDGRFIPPMRTLVGPEIRNPTFYGVTYEAWIECALMAPPVGALERVWMFPVDNRDEYMAQLANQGLSEYEGMDGVTILRETDTDGNAHIWHLEWLPGSVAVFGADRSAVAAARQLYAENSASRGLLAGAGGRYVEPDILVRLLPPRLAMWQDRIPGQYWWREKIDRLTRDLVRYWQPNPARVRFIGMLADRLAAWPRGVEQIDASVWFEPDGVEWRLRAAGDFSPSTKGQLGVFRRVPERAALAYALPVSPESFRRFGGWAGGLLLDAAGGVVTRDARQLVLDIFDRLSRGSLREAAWAWVAPPANNPGLGGTRLLIMDWAAPEMLERAWNMIAAAVGPDTPLAQVFSQLGWNVSIRRDELHPHAVEIVATGTASGTRVTMYDAIACYRRQGNIAALAIGASRPDAAERRKVVAYRTALAAQAVEETGAGGADVRGAFTRMGSGGAGMLGIFTPVRFLQLSLVETADWRPRSPDQHEPLSTQLAREMLEYGAGNAWTVGAEANGRGWDFNGGMSWRSLSRLSAALGITESIGMDD